MNSIKERAALIQEAAKKLNKEIYQDSGQSKNVAPRTNGLTNSHKVGEGRETVFPKSNIHVRIGKHFPLHAG